MGKDIVLCKSEEHMQLLGLMESYSDVVDWVGSSIEIDGITPDSDRVLPGYLFVALPCAGEDGHSRVHQALLKGAAAVLGEWSPDDLPEYLPWGVFTYVHVLDVAKAWFWLCHNWGHLCKLGADPAHDHTDGPTAGLPDSALRR
jgi:UDP-N-acetylmuramyl pentapeptide synthase